MAYNCPVQNKQTIKGSFPENIKSRLQYGNDLRAFVVTLNASGMIAVKRLHDILMTKVKRIIADTFRTPEGADTLIKITSYISTLAKNGIGSFEAIKTSIKGQSVELLI
jgi:hypothetical protein